jgi:hypothetical protein
MESHRDPKSKEVLASLSEMDFKNISEHEKRELAKKAL